jgi:hypothetical protein
MARSRATDKINEDLRKEERYAYLLEEEELRTVRGMDSSKDSWVYHRVRNGTLPTQFLMVHEWDKNSQKVRWGSSIKEWEQYRQRQIDYTRRKALAVPPNSQSGNGSGALEPIPRDDRMGVTSPSKEALDFLPFLSSHSTTVSPPLSDPLPALTAPPRNGNVIGALEPTPRDDRMGVISPSKEALDILPTLSDRMSMVSPPVADPFSTTVIIRV